MFNVSKWKSDVKAIEAEIRIMKQTIRTPGYNASGVMWCGLYDLKARATAMYRVRAHYRGKLHNKVTETLDEQRLSFSNALWASYVAAYLEAPIETVA